MLDGCGVLLLFIGFRYAICRFLFPSIRGMIMCAWQVR